MSLSIVRAQAYSPAVLSFAWKYRYNCRRCLSQRALGLSRIRLEPALTLIVSRHCALRRYLKPPPLFLLVEALSGPALLAAVYPASRQNSERPERGDCAKKQKGRDNPRPCV